MPKRYKLTDAHGFTFNNTQWGPGVTHTARRPNPKAALCTRAWIHVYDDPLLAVFLAPIHVSFHSPRLWECRTRGRSKDDDGLKRGYPTVTTVREIPLPEVTTTQRVAFGILCAMEVCNDREWRKWAKAWLSGNDRSKQSTEVAWDYVADVAPARAADAAYVAADADVAPARAARAAVYAADAARAAATTKRIDLITLARKAMKVKP